VYWFDDEAKSGGCRVPASWNLLYRRGNDWVPVEAATFGTAKDQFNRVIFSEVKTDGLRIEVQLKPNMSAGILEWEVP
jgi:hypothetical protein